MLYDISHYYQKSHESGIASMNCRISACNFYPLTGQIKYWPEVKTFRDYIHKCYAIAQEVPVDDLRHEYYEARFRSKRALRKVLEKVQYAHQELNHKNVNYMMGYTPITHVQEQLQKLENEIFEDIQNYKPFYTPAQKSWFDKLWRK